MNTNRVIKIVADTTLKTAKLYTESTNTLNTNNKVFIHTDYNNKPQFKLSVDEINNFLTISSTYLKISNNCNISPNNSDVNKYLIHSHNIIWIYDFNNDFYIPILNRYVKSNYNNPQNNEYGFIDEEFIITSKEDLLAYLNSDISITEYIAYKEDDFLLPKKTNNTFLCVDSVEDLTYTIINHTPINKLIKAYVKNDDIIIEYKKNTNVKKIVEYTTNINEYSSNQSYLLDDIVYYNGLILKANVDNPSNPLSLDLDILDNPLYEQVFNYTKTELDLLNGYNFRLKNTNFVENMDIYNPLCMGSSIISANNEYVEISYDGFLNESLPTTIDEVSGLNIINNNLELVLDYTNPKYSIDSESLVWISDTYVESAYIEGGVIKDGLFGEYLSKLDLYTKEYKNTLQYSLVSGNTYELKFNNIYFNINLNFTINPTDSFFKIGMSSGSEAFLSSNYFDTSDIYIDRGGITLNTPPNAPLNTSIKDYYYNNNLYYTYVMQRIGSPFIIKSEYFKVYYSNTTRMIDIILDNGVIKIYPTNTFNVDNLSSFIIAQVNITNNLLDLTSSFAPVDTYIKPIDILIDNFSKLTDEDYTHKIQVNSQKGIAELTGGVLLSNLLHSGKFSQTEYSVWFSGVFLSGTFEGGVWYDGLLLNRKNKGLLHQYYKDYYNELEYLSIKQGGTLNGGYWTYGKHTGGHMSSDFHLTSLANGLFDGGTTSDIMWLNGDFNSGDFNSTLTYNFKSIESIDKLQNYNAVYNYNGNDLEIINRNPLDFYNLKTAPVYEIEMSNSQSSFDNYTSELFLRRLIEYKDYNLLVGQPFVEKDLINLNGINLNGNVLNNTYNTLNQFNTLQLDVNLDSISTEFGGLNYLNNKYTFQINKQYTGTDYVVPTSPRNLDSQINNLLNNQGRILNDFNSEVVYQKTYQKITKLNTNSKISITSFNKGRVTGGELNLLHTKSQMFILDNLSQGNDINLIPTNLLDINYNNNNKNLYWNNGILSLRFKVNPDIKSEDLLDILILDSKLSFLNLIIDGDVINELVLKDYVVLGDVERILDTPTQTNIDTRYVVMKFEYNNSITTITKNLNNITTFANKDTKYNELFNNILCSNITLDGGTLNSGVLRDGVWINGIKKGYDNLKRINNDLVCLLLNGVAQNIDIDGGLLLGGYLLNSTIKSGIVDNIFNLTLINNTEFGDINDVNKMPIFAGGLVETTDLTVHNMYYIGGSILLVTNWNNGVWGNGRNYKNELLYSGTDGLYESFIGNSLDYNNYKLLVEQIDILKSEAQTTEDYNKIRDLQALLGLYYNTGAAPKVYNIEAGTNPNGIYDLTFKIVEPHRYQTGYRFFVDDLNDSGLELLTNRELFIDEVVHFTTDDFSYKNNSPVSLTNKYATDNTYQYYINDNNYNLMLQRYSSRDSLKFKLVLNDFEYDRLNPYTIGTTSNDVLYSDIQAHVNNIIPDVSNDMFNSLNLLNNDSINYPYFDNVSYNTTYHLELDTANLSLSALRLSKIEISGLIYELNIYLNDFNATTSSNIGVYLVEELNKLNLGYLTIKQTMNGNVNYELELFNNTESIGRILLDEFNGNIDPLLGNNSVIDSVDNLVRTEHILYVDEMSNLRTIQKMNNAVVNVRIFNGLNLNNGAFGGNLTNIKHSVYKSKDLTSNNSLQQLGNGFSSLWLRGQFKSGLFLNGVLNINHYIKNYYIGGELVTGKFLNGVVLGGYFQNILLEKGYFNSINRIDINEIENTKNYVLIPEKLEYDYNNDDETLNILNVVGIESKLDYYINNSNFSPFWIYDIGKNNTINLPIALDSVDSTDTYNYNYGYSTLGRGANFTFEVNLHKPEINIAPFKIYRSDDLSNDSELYYLPQDLNDATPNKDYSPLTKIDEIVYRKGDWIHMTHQFRKRDVTILNLDRLVQDTLGRVNINDELLTITETYINKTEIDGVFEPNYFYNTNSYVLGSLDDNKNIIRATININDIEYFSQNNEIFLNGDGNESRMTGFWKIVKIDHKVTAPMDATLTENNNGLIFTINNDNYNNINPHALSFVDTYNAATKGTFAIKRIQGNSDSVIVIENVTKGEYKLTNYNIGSEFPIDNFSYPLAQINLVNGELKVSYFGSNLVPTEAYLYLEKLDEYNNTKQTNEKYSLAYLGDLDLTDLSGNYLIELGNVFKLDSVERVLDTIDPPNKFDNKYKYAGKLNLNFTYPQFKQLRDQLYKSENLPSKYNFNIEWNNGTVIYDRNLSNLFHNIDSIQSLYYDDSFGVNVLNTNSTQLGFLTSSNLLTIPTSEQESLEYAQFNVTAGVPTDHYNLILRTPIPYMNYNSGVYEFGLNISQQTGLYNSIFSRSLNPFRIIKDVKNTYNVYSNSLDEITGNLVNSYIENSSLISSNVYNTFMVNCDLKNTNYQNCYIDGHDYLGGYNIETPVKLSGINLLTDVKTDTLEDYKQSMFKSFKPLYYNENTLNGIRSAYTKFKDLYNNPLYNFPDFVIDDPNNISGFYGATANYLPNKIVNNDTKLEYAYDRYRLYDNTYFSRMRKSGSLLTKGIIDITGVPNLDRAVSDNTWIDDIFYTPQYWLNNDSLKLYMGETIEVTFELDARLSTNLVLLNLIFNTGNLISINGIKNTISLNVRSWSSKIKYYKNDFVVFGDGNVSLLYRCITNESLNQNPETYLEKVCQHWIDGIDGTYTKGTIVIYQSSIYICKNETNENPITSNNLEELTFNKSGLNSTEPYVILAREYKNADEDYNTNQNIDFSRLIDSPQFEHDIYTNREYPLNYEGEVKNKSIFKVYLKPNTSILNDEKYSSFYNDKGIVDNFTKFYEYAKQKDSVYLTYRSKSGEMQLINNGSLSSYMGRHYVEENVTDLETVEIQGMELTKYRYYNSGFQTIEKLKTKEDFEHLNIGINGYSGVNINFSLSSNKLSRLIGIGNLGNISNSAHIIGVFTNNTPENKITFTNKLLEDITNYKLGMSNTGNDILSLTSNDNKNIEFIDNKTIRLYIENSSGVFVDVNNELFNYIKGNINNEVINKDLQRHVSPASEHIVYLDIQIIIPVVVQNNLGDQDTSNDLYRIESKTYDVKGYAYYKDINSDYLELEFVEETEFSFDINDFNISDDTFETSDSAAVALSTYTNKYYGIVELKVWNHSEQFVGLSNEKSNINFAKTTLKKGLFEGSVLDFVNVGDNVGEIEHNWDLILKDTIATNTNMYYGFLLGGEFSGVLENPFVNTNKQAIWNYGIWNSGVWKRGHWFSMTPEGDYQPYQSQLREGELKSIGEGVSVFRTYENGSINSIPLNSSNVDVSYYNKYLMLDNLTSTDYDIENGVYDIGGTDLSNLSVWHGGMFNVESVELGEVLYPVYEKLDEYKSYLDSDYSRKFNDYVDDFSDIGLVNFIKELPQDTESYFNDDFSLNTNKYSNKFQSYLLTNNISKTDFRFDTDIINTQENYTNLKYVSVKYIKNITSTQNKKDNNNTYDYSYGDLVINDDTIYAKLNTKSKLLDGVLLRGLLCGGVFYNGRFTSTNPLTYETENRLSIWYRGAFYGYWYAGQLHSLRGNILKNGISGYYDIKSNNKSVYVINDTHNLNDYDKKYKFDSVDITFAPKEFVLTTPNSNSEIETYVGGVVGGVIEDYMYSTFYGNVNPVRPSYNFQTAKILDTFNKNQYYRTLLGLDNNKNPNKGWYKTDFVTIDNIDIFTASYQYITPNYFYNEPTNNTLYVNRVDYTNDIIEYYNNPNNLDNPYQKQLFDIADNHSIFGGLVSNSEIKNKTLDIFLGRSQSLLRSNVNIELKQFGETERPAVWLGGQLFGGTFMYSVLDDATLNNYNVLFGDKRLLQLGTEIEITYNNYNNETFKEVYNYSNIDGDSISRFNMIDIGGNMNTPYKGNISSFEQFESHQDYKFKSLSNEQNNNYDLDLNSLDINKSYFDVNDSRYNQIFKSTYLGILQKTPKRLRYLKPYNPSGLYHYDLVGVLPNTPEIEGVNFDDDAFKYPEEIVNNLTNLLINDNTRYFDPHHEFDLGKLGGSLGILNLSGNNQYPKQNTIVSGFKGLPSEIYNLSGVNETEYFKYVETKAISNIYLQKLDLGYNLNLSSVVYEKTPSSEDIKVSLLTRGLFYRSLLRNGLSINYVNMHNPDLNIKLIEPSLIDENVNVGDKIMLFDVEHLDDYKNETFVIDDISNYVVDPNTEPTPPYIIFNITNGVFNIIEKDLTELTTGFVFYIKADNNLYTLLFDNFDNEIEVVEVNIDQYPVNFNNDEYIPINLETNVLNVAEYILRPYKFNFNWLSNNVQMDWIKYYNSSTISEYKSSYPYIETYDDNGDGKLIQVLKLLSPYDSRLIVDSKYPNFYDIIKENSKFVQSQLRSGLNRLGYFDECVLLSGVLSDGEFVNSTLMSGYHELLLSNYTNVNMINYNGLAPVYDFRDLSMEVDNLFIDFYAEEMSPYKQIYLAKGSNNYHLNVTTWNTEVIKNVANYSTNDYYYSVIAPNRDISIEDWVTFDVRNQYSRPKGYNKSEVFGLRFVGGVDNYASSLEDGRFLGSTLNGGVLNSGEFYHLPKEYTGTLWNMDKFYTSGVASVLSRGILLGGIFSYPLHNSAEKLALSIDFDFNNQLDSYTELGTVYDIVSGNPIRTTSMEEVVNIELRNSNNKCVFLGLEAPTQKDMFDLGLRVGKMYQSTLGVDVQYIKDKIEYNTNNYPVYNTETSQFDIFNGNNSQLLVTKDIQGNVIDREVIETTRPVWFEKVGELTHELESGDDSVAYYMSKSANASLFKRGSVKAERVRIPSDIQLSPTKYELDNLGYFHYRLTDSNGNVIEERSIEADISERRPIGLVDYDNLDNLISYESLGLNYTEHNVDYTKPYSNLVPYALGYNMFIKNPDVDTDSTYFTVYKNTKHLIDPNLFYYYQAIEMPIIQQNYLRKAQPVPYSYIRANNDFFIKNGLIFDNLQLDRSINNLASDTYMIVYNRQTFMDSMEYLAYIYSTDFDLNDYSGEGVLGNRLVPDFSFDTITYFDESRMRMSQRLRGIKTQSMTFLQYNFIESEFNGSMLGGVFDDMLKFSLMYPNQITEGEYKLYFKEEPYTLELPVNHYDYAAIKPSSLVIDYTKLNMKSQTSIKKVAKLPNNGGYKFVSVGSLFPSSINSGNLKGSTNNIENIVKHDSLDSYTLYNSNLLDVKYVDVPNTIEYIASDNVIDINNNSNTAETTSYFSQGVLEMVNLLVRFHDEIADNRLERFISYKEQTVDLQMEKSIHSNHNRSRMWSKLVPKLSCSAELGNLISSMAFHYFYTAVDKDYLFYNYGIDLNNKQISMDVLGYPKQNGINTYSLVESVYNGLMLKNIDLKNGEVYETLTLSLLNSDIDNKGYYPLSGKMMKLSDVGEEHSYVYSSYEIYPSGISIAELQKSKSNLNLVYGNLVAAQGNFFNIEAIDNIELRYSYENNLGLEGYHKSLDYYNFNIISETNKHKNPLDVSPLIIDNSRNQNIELYIMNSLPNYYWYYAVDVKDYAKLWHGQKELITENEIEIREEVLRTLVTNKPLEDVFSTDGNVILIGGTAEEIVIDNITLSTAAGINLTNYNLPNYTPVTILVKDEADTRYNGIYKLERWTPDGSVLNLPKLVRIMIFTKNGLALQGVNRLPVSAPTGNSSSINTNKYFRMTIDTDLFVPNVSRTIIEKIDKIQNGFNPVYNNIVGIDETIEWFTVPDNVIDHSNNNVYDTTAELSAPIQYLKYIYTKDGNGARTVKAVAGMPKLYDPYNYGVGLDDADYGLTTIYLTTNYNTWYGISVGERFNRPNTEIAYSKLTWIDEITDNAGEWQHTETEFINRVRMEPVISSGFDRLDKQYYMQSLEATMALPGAAFHSLHYDDNAISNAHLTYNNGIPDFYYNSITDIPLEVSDFNNTQFNSKFGKVVLDSGGGYVGNGSYGSALVRNNINPCGEFALYNEVNYLYKYANDKGYDFNTSGVNIVQYIHLVYDTTTPNKPTDKNLKKVTISYYLNREVKLKETTLFRISEYDGHLAVYGFDFVPMYDSYKSAIFSGTNTNFDSDTYTINSMKLYYSTFLQPIQNMGSITDINVDSNFDISITYSNSPGGNSEYASISNIFNRVSLDLGIGIMPHLLKFHNGITPFGSQGLLPFAAKNFSSFATNYKGENYNSDNSTYPQYLTNLNTPKIDFNNSYPNHFISVLDWYGFKQTNNLTSFYFNRDIVNYLGSFRAMNNTIYDTKICDDGADYTYLGFEYDNNIVYRRVDGGGKYLTFVDNRFQIYRNYALHPVNGILFKRPLVDIFDSFDSLPTRKYDNITPSIDGKIDVFRAQTVSMDEIFEIEGYKNGLEEVYDYTTYGYSITSTPYDAHPLNRFGNNSNENINQLTPATATTTSYVVRYNSDRLKLKRFFEYIGGNDYDNYVFYQGYKNYMGDRRPYDDQYLLQTDIFVDKSGLNRVLSEPVGYGNIKLKRVQRCTCSLYAEETYLGLSVQGLDLLDFPIKDTETLNSYLYLRNQYSILNNRINPSDTSAIIEEVTNLKTATTINTVNMPIAHTETFGGDTFEVVFNNIVHDNYTITDLGQHSQLSKYKFLYDKSQRVNYAFNYDFVCLINPKGLILSHKYEDKPHKKFELF